MKKILHEITEERFHKKYELCERIGGGAQGDVLKIKNKNQDEYLALKRIRLENISEKEVSGIVGTMLKIACIKSPYIVSFKFYFLGIINEDSESTLNIGMELLEMNLKDKILQNKKLRAPQTPFEEILKLLKTIAGALYVLDSHNMSHCDIKPQNIMIDSSGEYRLIDFTSTNERKNMGTLKYMPPEVIEEFYTKKPYSPVKSDIFSLGATILELITLDTDSVLQLRSADYEYETLFGSSIIDEYGISFSNLLKKMLSIKPELRPSISDLIDFTEMSVKGSCKRKEGSLIQQPIAIQKPSMFLSFLGLCILLLHNSELSPRWIIGNILGLTTLFPKLIGVIFAFRIKNSYYLQYHFLIHSILFIAYMLFFETEPTDYPLEEKWILYSPLGLLLMFLKYAGRVFIEIIFFQTVKESDQNFFYFFMYFLTGLHYYANLKLKMPIVFGFKSGLKSFRDKFLCDTVLESLIFIFFMGFSIYALKIFTRELPKKVQPIERKREKNFGRLMASSLLLFFLGCSYEFDSIRMLIFDPELGLDLVKNETKNNWKQYIQLSLLYVLVLSIAINILVKEAKKRFYIGIVFSLASILIEGLLIMDQCMGSIFLIKFTLRAIPIIFWADFYQKLNQIYPFAHNLQMIHIINILFRYIVFFLSLQLEYQTLHRPRIIISETALYFAFWTRAASLLLATGLILYNEL